MPGTAYLQPRNVQLRWDTAPIKRAAAASWRRNARPGPVSDPSPGHSDGKSQRAEEAGDIARRLAEITGRPGRSCLPAGKS